MCSCGSCGPCGEGPGAVKQELRERDGGGRGGCTSGGGGRVRFKVGRLRVGGDLYVGWLRLRLAWL